MAVYYLNKAADRNNDEVLNDFILCCRTFK